MGHDVLIDVDDLLVDLRTPTRELFAKYSVPFAEEGVDFCGGDLEIYRWYQRQVNRMPGFCRTLVPRPGAQEFVKELRKLSGVTCVAVTAPQYGPYWIPERMEALKDLFGFCEDPVHFCWSKFRVEGSVILEDNHKNLFKWVGQQKGHGLLLEHPWTVKEHRASQNLSFLQRAGSCTTFTAWEHALEMIENLLFKRNSRP